MTSTSLFLSFLARGAMTVVAAVSLADCSSMKDLSPFGSDVPYSQNVKPTLTQPSVTEVPAFKPTPKPPASAAPAAAPSSPAPAPAAPASAAPASSSADPAPPPPPASQSSLDPQPTAKVASAAPVPDAASDAAAAEPPMPQGRPGHPVTRPANAPPPFIPDAALSFKDDGTYPNLARVPARPVNMPTFLEASGLEKTLVADREAAKEKQPDSPANPAPDSLPAPAEAAPAGTAAASAAPAAPPPAPAEVAARTEDAAPCLSSRTLTSEPAATLRFEPGSAALNADDLVILADAIPIMRGSKGSIRVFAHGDTDAASARTSSGAARFDLAAARAGAVAQALAGYGIAPLRIAVGVACVDESLAGASVQLYADS